MDKAEPRDVSELSRLRDEAARWLQHRGIRQWLPGEVTPADLAGQVARGEWFVRRGNSGMVAAMRFLLSDEPVWGVRDPDSAYVHGLVVDRAYAGAGVGTELLRWAAERAVSMNLRYLRLDCVQGNPSLLAYYLQSGFVEVGRREFDDGWLPVVLLEQVVV